MLPNRWKTMAFCVGLSAAGLATCADQPTGQLHKAKKADAPIEVAEVKVEDLTPPVAPAAPLAEAKPIQVREFTLDFPADFPARKVEEAPKPPVPILLPGRCSICPKRRPQ